MFKYSHVPAYSFGKSTKPDGTAKLPGPGAYDPDKADRFTRKQEATSVKLKPSHEPNFNSKSQVGPGQYDLPDDNWAKPSTKFSKAERGKWNPNPVPGPGQYDYEHIQETIKSEQQNVKFGKAPRNSHGGNLKAIPGPGQYDVQEVSQRVERFRAKSGYKFDKSDRVGMYKDKPVPGPGAYDAKQEYVLEHKRGYSLGKAKYNQLLPSKTVPGPGAYEPVLTSANPNVKFGKDERVTIPLKKGVPGPGQYDASDQFNKLSAKPGVKFCKSEAHFKENKVPGPGNYDPKVGALEKRSVPFLKEERGKVVPSRVPGPGQYDNTLDLTAKVGNFKFGKEPRGKSAVKPVPGPGAYDPKTESSQPTYKIGKQERLIDHKSIVPGPGNYNYDPKLWDKHFPKFGQAGALGQKQNPVGPGMYEIPGTIPDVPRYNYPDSANRKIKV